MSTASFCKKFKERTGITLIQYINFKKIEQVKIILWGKLQNYMVRVFKRVTGQTISDYRRGGTEILSSR